IISIKNGSMAGKDSVVLPYSNIKFQIANLLKTRGFIAGVAKKGKKNRYMEISLAYNSGESRVTDVKRISKSSRRIYKKVKEIYQKKLILEGVGYKSEVKGTKLALALGFSHPVELEIPAGLTVTAEKNVLTFSGIDKALVGEFTAKVRSLKKPEPYKGKGF